MKFDVVVGNPPYQDENVGNNNQATPVYNYFYEFAEKIGNEYSLISPARFLSNQGATPKVWNKKMLNDKHLEIAYFNSKSMAVFPGVDIKGGVVILHRNQDENFGAIDTFIPFDELRSIFHKIKLCSENTLSSIVFSPDSYRLTDRVFEDHPELRDRTDASHLRAVASSVFTRYPEIFFDEMPQDGEKYSQIYGRLSGERTYKYMKRVYIAEHANLDKWKVILPGANGTGAFGETLSTPIIGEPGIGHSQTFVSIGAFDTKFEAEALLKYIKSKFGRAMLGIMKTTQNNQSKNSWSKVPLQNFTETLNDVDWNDDINKIDGQLYEKYGLTSDEKMFIEDNVKSMA
ncbi:Eco57I restriction-modification methylase domain-containing protein [Lactococcus carnosus]|uniref:Eco57I restriction-modification methylase domain-containing protein n=1 Tax=Pseudolactococcus carnosus TaxID=2749961 RepID=UPI000811FFAB|nr:Eco57I restriction-modification methylase domain-containing protein [Lactococcus carnosus]MCJ1968730.1 restriction endonuclease [Lactococcus carnosus]SCA91779.1 putative restriction endonuclease [Lactococcus piscium]